MGAGPHGGWAMAMRDDAQMGSGGVWAWIWPRHRNGNCPVLLIFFLKTPSVLSSGEFFCRSPTLSLVLSRNVLLTFYLPTSPADCHVIGTDWADP